MTDEIVPNSARDFGNTNNKIPPKQCNKAIKWCFTFNNYNSNDILEIVPILKEKCKKFIFQEEIGENGTPHLQGAIILKEKMRPTELNLSKKIHWELMKNEEASVKYCSKLDTRKKGSEPVIFGFPKPVKIIENLKPWQKEIEELFFTEPDGRSIHWYWENKGGVGKSSFCKYMYVKHKAITIQGGKEADIMNIIFNLDMDECKMLIIDVPRNKGNNISYSSVECILNGMITNTKYETGVKVFNAPHVVVFCNFEPDEDRLSEDRWKIKEIV